MVIDMKNSTSERKDEHLELSLNDSIEGPNTTWLEHVHLIHNPLPELSLDDVNTKVRFLGKELRAPLIILGMTGGTEKAYNVNRELAKLANEFGIAIGVGSQRAMIEDRSVEYTYRVVREFASDVPVIANIGATQLVRYDIKDIEWIIEVLEADALAVHLNPAQELVQPEGDRDFRGVLNRLVQLRDVLSVPIIVKEVGSGIPREVAKVLYDVGIRYFDVGGAGGTNWIAIEMLRLQRRGLGDAKIAKNFLSWGLPTAVSVVEVRDAAPNATIIASGGIRTGIDVAKCIALGSDLAGFARPMLKALVTGNAREFLKEVIVELRMTMLLVGAKDLEELKRVSIVILDKLAQWICARRLRIRNPRAYIPC